MDPGTPASTVRWTQIGKPIFRIIVCIATVYAITAVLYTVPLRDRVRSSILTFLLITLIFPALWGFRYSLFVLLLAALGFSWLLPPVGHFWLSNPRDVFALAGFLVVGAFGSYLSARVRKEALKANQRRVEAIAEQRRFRDLVNSVEGIVWEADAETFVFSFVSEQAERILGYPTERWLSETTFWKDHVHPEDRDWAVRFCVQATTEKRDHDFQYRMIAADGRVVWLRDLVTVVVENGRATRLRGVMVDVTERMRNEEALREQARLLDLTHDAIIARDMNGTVRSWNGGAEALYGWPAEQARGKVIHDLLKTVFPEPLEQIDEEVMRTGRWEGDLAHTRNDGTTVIVASRWSLQRDDRGAPIAILETNNDITEAKRAELAREEMEERWRAAFESNPTMYFMVDQAGSILSVNAFGAEQLGYSSSQLVGQPVLNVFYEPDRASVRTHASDCFQQLGRTMRWEARKIRKDGTMLWVRETGKAVVLKKHPVLLVVCEDITEGKRAEQALRRSETYLAESQRLTHTGSWAVEPNTREPIYLSDELIRMWGYDPRDGLPNRGQLLERIHPDDRDRVQALSNQAVREKKDVDYECRIVLPEGTVKHIHATVHVVLDAAGDIVEVLGTDVDVTDRKRAEQERERLRRLEADLARVNRVNTMGELTASLAHEINQPIAATVTNANTSVRWLAGETPNIGEAREAAKRAAKDATRAAEIINRIRSLFRKGAPQRELVDVNAVIDEMMVLLLRTEANLAGVSIRSELAADLPEIMADRVQLQQVVLNLMMNGIDAMKELDGTRTLTVASHRDGNDELIVSVSDTGVGLPPDKGKLFDPFFTTKPHGTGMGLAISRTIVEAHGGRLWAGSNSGLGATFFFALPIKTEAQG